MTQQQKFHNRENRKGRMDPSFNLFRTLSWTAADSNIDVGATFSAAKRAEPITFRVKIERGAATPNGVILELGSSTRGLALYIDDDTLGFVAGAGATDDFCSVTSDAFFTETGQKADVVVSVLPGTGEARMWVNGLEQGRDTAATPAFLWADTGAGAVGDVQGTVTPRIPAGQRVTLANLTLTSPVSVFTGQRPRQFS